LHMYAATKVKLSLAQPARQHLVLATRAVK